jgi:hypothetical protein
MLSPTMSDSLSASLCRAVTLTFACAVFAGSAAEEESVDGVTAQQILDRMAAAYAN